MSYNRPQANTTNGESWSEADEDLLLELGEDDEYTIPEIAAEFDGRTQQSIKNKLRKLRKREGIYNTSYADRKHQINADWIADIADKIDSSLRVFDAYGGVGDSTTVYLEHADEVEVCEIEPAKYDRLVSGICDTGKLHHNIEGKTNSGCPYRVIGFSDGSEVRCLNENVNNVLHRRVGTGNKEFDFIDLDPCGTPFTAVPQAIRLISDGYMAVTYGDVQLHRWGRNAPLTKAYRMPEVDSFRDVVAHMIGWTMFEGVRQERSGLTRKLTPVNFHIFDNTHARIARTLYQVEKIGKLADVMNHLERELTDFRSTPGPAAAKYRFSEEELAEIQPN